MEKLFWLLPLQTTLKQGWMLSFILKTQMETCYRKTNFWKKSYWHFIQRMNACLYCSNSQNTWQLSYRWRTTSTSSTLKTFTASSTQYTSPDRVSVEDPSINVVKY